VGAVLAAALPSGTRVGPVTGVGDGVAATMSDGTVGGDDDVGASDRSGPVLVAGTADDGAGEAGTESLPRQPDTASRQARPRTTR
jgi:hypothetical protein